jgi:hypothetical protein
MQQRELKNKKEITQMQTDAQIKSSEINAAPAHIQANAAVQRLPAEINKLDADARNAVANAIRQYAEAKLTGQFSEMKSAEIAMKEEFAKAKLTELQTRNTAAALVSALDENPENAGAMVMNILGGAAKGAWRKVFGGKKKPEVTTRKKFFMDKGKKVYYEGEKIEKRMQ